MKELKTNIAQLLNDIENCDSLIIYHNRWNLKLDKDYFLWSAKKHPYKYNNYYTYHVFENSIFILDIKELENFD
jgi:hypothetical protein